MKRTKGFAVCTAAAMAASVLMSATAMAGEDTIVIPYQQEDAWSQIAVTNDDVVSTGINIRSSASENSKVIGYLYHGGAAWVLNRGEEWTEIYSGGLTGFVKNEYLVYGADAEGMARTHGIEGVATTWDDVKLYEDMDGGSKVLDSLAYGDSFILTEAGEKWIQVQNGADSVAYVSSEDVSRVLLMDTAVAADTVYQGTSGGAGVQAGNTAGAGETYTDGSYSGETTPDYTYTEDNYTPDDSYTSDETYTPDDSYTPDGTYTPDDSYTPDDTYTPDDSYTPDDTYTPDDSDSSDDTYVDDSDDNSYYDADSDTMVNGGDSSQETGTQGLPTESYYDPETGIYYDASTGLFYDSGTGILYDAWWNPVNEAIAAPPQTDAPQTETPVTDTPQTEAPETDAPQTEAPSTGSSDDTALLAALIYCEAGNQSYEGMVAVGAVVMNRVYSPSFPNSISEVIYQGGQFTPASSGSLSSALANGVPSACYDAAVAAIGGENPVGGALYFNTGSGKGMKIGDHQFY